MYEAYFGLKEKPFNLSPDPSFLYMSPGHENVYSHLEYAVRENKGFAVITGEVGSGKTTLINYLIKSLGSDYKVGLISNTDLTADQLMRLIMLEFGLAAGAAGDRAGQLNEWTGFLARQGAKAQKVILIIDEAQNLPLPTLEGLRMLSNLEGEREQLMQIILVGQPELREKLKTRELRQLSQRVTVHAHVESLSTQDVYNYINHRLKIAGAGNPEAVFTPEAINQISYYSKGLPRIINYLCDTAMVYAFADELKVIGEETIASVVATRQIGGLMPAAEPESADETGLRPDSGNLSAGAGLDLEPLLSRLAVLEHRMSRLEETLASQNETGGTTVQIMEQAHQRDGIMLELLKMLNENITGRQQALGRLYGVYKTRKSNAPPLARPLVNRPNNPLNSSSKLAVGPSAAEAKPMTAPVAATAGQPGVGLAPGRISGPGTGAAEPGHSPEPTQLVPGEGLALGVVAADESLTLPPSGDDVFSGPQAVAEALKPHEATFIPGLPHDSNPKEGQPEDANTAKSRSLLSRLTGRKE